jgi:hypothetical protein
VQPVLADRCVAPEGAADQRVDAVSPDEDVGLVGGAVGEVQRHGAVVLLDALDVLVRAQDAGGQGGQHALVELGPEEPDEASAASVLRLDLGVALDVGPDLAAGVAELRLARRTEVVGVDTHHAQCLQGRRPQVEHVACGTCLRIPLEDDDVVARLVDRQRGGHAGRSAAEDGDPTAGKRALGR